MRSRLPKFVWVLLGIAIPVVAFRIYAVHKLSEQLQVVRKLGVPANTNALKRLYPELPNKKTVGTVLTNAAADLQPVSESQVPDKARPQLIFPGGQATWPRADKPLAKDLKKLIKLGIQDNRAALDKAKTAIHLKPQRMTKYPSRCWKADIPRIIANRPVSNFLYLDALWQARQGDFHEASRSLLAVLKFAEVWAQEHRLITAINRLAVSDPLLGTIENMLNDGSFKESDTNRLLAALARAEVLCRPSMKASLKLETCCAGIFFDSPDQLLQRRGEPTIWRTALAQGYELFAVNALDHRYYLAEMAGPLRISTKSIEKWYSMRRRVWPSKNSFHHWMSAIIGPRLKGLFRGNARLVTKLRLVQTALLVEKSRSRNDGALPPSLQSVAAEHPGRLPRDPFDGKRVHYETVRNEYVVYSVGPKKTNTVQRLSAKSDPTWNIPNDQLSILVQR